MVFHWSLSDSQSPKVSKTLLSILVDLNDAVVWIIYLMGRVFANDPEDLGSIPGHVIPKTFKMVIDTSLLNTQQYKERIKGKVEQSWK